MPELFVDPPDTLRHLDHFMPGHFYKNIFICIDRVLKRIDRFMPRRTREKAIRLAETLDHRPDAG